MKALPTEFDGRADQRGFQFKQVDRRGLIALFQKREWVAWEKRWADPTWEVVTVKERPAVSWPDGRMTEAHESMPSPEEWGTCGYSCGTLARAREVFNRELERGETAASAV